VRALYRSVEVHIAADAVDSGPVLAVSSHFGGFADPLLLVSISPRAPRVIARDKIWKIPIAGSVMRWLRAIPVHKPEEHVGLTSNDQMFASCYTALDEQSLLLIFPEGITVDDPSIARLKTGAARIALGARAAGTSGIQIVPAGIHYEDKAALRSRVFINIGSPLDLDSRLDRFEDIYGDETPENRPLVRALTDEIEDRLRRVAPDFADWDEAKNLTNAAEVALRARQDDPGEEVPAADRDRLAGQLGRTPSEAKQTVIDASNRYDRDLDAVGLTDAQAYEHRTFASFLWYAIWNILLGVVLLPFAIVGVVINFIPLLIVWLIGLLRVSPAVKATLKPMAALILFPLAWGVEAWQLASRGAGLIWTIIAIALIPLYLVAALLLSERLVLLWRAWKGWRGSRSLVKVGDAITQEREAVVAAVRTALEPGSGPAVADPAK
jgi:1-acyl-sn-glycerol-3-phosphate acyltransferase